MKRIIKSTLITLFLVIIVLPLIMRITAFTNLYIYTVFYTLLFSIIITYYFDQLNKISLGYLQVVLIAFVIPIVLYNLSFLGTYLYYHYTASGKEELTNILPPAGYSESSQQGLSSLLQKYQSPLDYSFVQSLSQRKMHYIFYYYSAEMYFLVLLQIISFPIVLLTFFSRYQLFKKINLNPILSVIYPFNYFSLINKFALPNIWKFFLFLPIVNFIIIYKINLRLVSLYNFPKSNALGILLLPFIFYPKMAFEVNKENVLSLEVNEIVSNID